MKIRFAFMGGLSLVTLLVMGPGTKSYAGAEESWLGDISDITCGRSHLKMSQGLFSPPECVVACTEKGKFVFVTPDKIYDIVNQDFAGLKEHPGEPVKLTGELKTEGIVISKIEPK